MIRPDEASAAPGAVSITIDESQFEKIEAIVQEFASKFHANKSSRCSESWWWNRPPESRCSFFSNSQHEGIMVEVFYEPLPTTFRVVLVKDVRMVGQFSTHEVEDAFNQLVVERLRHQYGERSVRVNR